MLSVLQHPLPGHKLKELWTYRADWSLVLAFSTHVETSSEDTLRKKCEKYVDSLQRLFMETNA